MLRALHDCLHPSASYSQSRDLIGAKPGEEPNDGESTQHLQRVEGLKLLGSRDFSVGLVCPASCAMVPPKRTVLCTQVEASPQELGPDVILNDPRCNAYLMFEMSWGSKHSLGI